MRIRNRRVPLPLSSLSPVPLSDPDFSRSPVVQLQLQDDPHQNLPQEADKDDSFDTHPTNQPIGGGGSNGGDCSDGDEGQQDDSKVLLKGGEKRGGGGDKSNDTRKGPKGRIMGAGIESVILEQSNSPRQGVGRWCEGDEAFPLKKRRGSFDRKSNEETIIEKDKKMKTKMNKKCVQQNGNQVEESEDKETKERLDHGISASGIGAKKRGRGGVLMEGSRCSRVNGRGWRCCQQTLVGYSLCEHHLGKGRLRSMNSVRSRSVAPSTAASKKSKSSQPLSSSQFTIEEKGSTKHTLYDNKVDGEVEDGEEKKPGMAAAKKKMKLGTVKARSMSSLLGQADNSIAVAENNK